MAGPGRAARAHDHGGIRRTVPKVVAERGDASIGYAVGVAAGNPGGGRRSRQCQSHRGTYILHGGSGRTHRTSADPGAASKARRTRNDRERSSR